MKIHVNLGKEFGRPASITLKEHISDSYPDAVKEELAIDLEALLKIVGGLTVNVVEDAYPNSPSLIYELMDLLQQFAHNKMQEDTK